MGVPDRHGMFDYGANHDLKTITFGLCRALAQVTIQEIVCLSGFVGDILNVLIPGKVSCNCHTQVFGMGVET